MDTSRRASHSEPEDTRTANRQAAVTTSNASLLDRIPHEKRHPRDKAQLTMSRKEASRALMRESSRRVALLIGNGSSYDRTMSDTKAARTEDHIDS